MKALRGSRVITTLSLTSALGEVGGQRHARERDPLRILQQTGRSQVRSGRVRKISHSPGFDL